MKLYFGTHNEGKLKEAKEILGVDVEGISMEVDEVQSLDPIEVATKKAWGYYKEVQKPLFAEDVSLTFNALKLLPGTFIDYFLKTLGNEGLLKLLNGVEDRSATLKATIVYIDENEKEHVVHGEINGTIAESERGDGGFGFDPIFIPEGYDKTYAEMGPEEKNKLSHRAIALGKLREFLDQEAK